jgi:HPt (histidine-containing phosphotransfer) domain-containing protein
MLSAIRYGIARKDADAVARAAHSLKGSLATFAATQSFDLALKLERLGRSKGLDDAERVFEALTAEIKRVRTALEGFDAQQHQTSENAPLQGNVKSSR